MTCDVGFLTVTKVHLWRGCDSGGDCARGGGGGVYRDPLRYVLDCAVSLKLLYKIKSIAHTQLVNSRTRG